MSRPGHEDVPKPHRVGKPHWYDAHVAPSGPRRILVWWGRLTYKWPHGIRHTLLRPWFWIGLLIGATWSFPLEHWLWEKVWPFDLITKAMGI